MKKRYKTIVAILLSLVLLFVGMIQGQQEQVFRKAVKICLECVGLG